MRRSPVPDGHATGIEENRINTLTEWHFEMAKSIIQAHTGKHDRECFLCRLEADRNGYYGELPHTGLHKHHFIHGVSGRRLAEKWGLWAYLCRNHHTEGPEAVHNNREKDLFLQQIAQGRFERLYNHEKWMEIFGKNYLIM